MLGGPCLLVCRDCGDVRHQFEDYTARGQWTAVHIAATGHRSFWQIDGQPDGQELADAIAERERIAKMMS